jgi:RND family efflux transporter MFP subunit
LKRTWIAAVALLAGCSPAKSPAPDPSPSALVRTVLVSATTLPESLTVYGSAEVTAAGERVVTAPLEAIVTQVLVAIGDRVAIGQPVVRVQPSPASRLELARTVRDAQTTQAAYARALRLRSTGLVSDADVETARAAAATAQTLSQSLASRSTDVLRAPGGGIVEAVSSAPGDLVAAGVSIIKIGPGEGSRVRLGLDPQVASKVRPGQVVRLTPTAGGPMFTGRVKAVDPRADAQTRMASAFADISGGLPIGAGQPLQGVIVVGERQGVASVPHEALLYEGEKPYLFVVAGGVAHRREVVVGLESNGSVEIQQGVKVGERVAVNGGTALQEGMTVREEATAAGRRR